MSDGTGIFQHAIFNVPDFHHGYCTDDNARAFILCNLLDELGGEPPKENLNGFTTSYLAFLASALNRDTGRFRNFMSHGRQWLEDAGSEDSHGRALWALGCRGGAFPERGPAPVIRSTLRTRPDRRGSHSPRRAPGRSRCWAFMNTCARFPDSPEAEARPRNAYRQAGDALAEAAPRRTGPGLKRASPTTTPVSARP